MEEKLTNIVDFYSKMAPEMLAIGLKDLVGINRVLLKEFLSTSYDTEEILSFLANNKYLFTL